MLGRSGERGDTLVEVLLAVVILSIVTIGCLSIMNKGTALSLDVLERSEVRARVNQQIEVLNYIRDQYAFSTAAQSNGSVYPDATLWTEIRSSRLNSVGTPNTTSPNSCTPNANSFYISKKANNSDGRSYELLSTNKGKPTTGLTPTPGDGIWIEAVRADEDVVVVSYIDFYIKACWEPGVGAEDARISSAVRLYDR